MDNTSVQRRKNASYRRQGEWFFVPIDFRPVGNIHRNEPIRRPKGKPHICQELIRQGGTQVYVSRVGAELSEADYNVLRRTNHLRAATFTRQTKEPSMYVRGYVRHPDHATIILPGWHRVYVNGEIGSANVTFYD